MKPEISTTRTIGRLCGGSSVRNAGVCSLRCLKGAEHGKRRNGPGGSHLPLLRMPLEAECHFRDTTSGLLWTRWAISDGTWSDESTLCRQTLHSPDKVHHRVSLDSYPDLNGDTDGMIARVLHEFFVSSQTVRARPKGPISS